MSDQKEFKFESPKCDPSKIPTYGEVKEKMKDDGISAMVDILRHIRKAQMEAEIQHIKANMIVIDRDIAIANHLYVPSYTINGDVLGVNEYAPRVFGLEVRYRENLTKDLGANFLITEGPERINRIKELEAENAELKDKLEKVKELLGVYDA